MCIELWFIISRAYGIEKYFKVYTNKTNSNLFV